MARDREAADAVTVLQFPQPRVLQLCRTCGRGMRPLIYANQPTHPGCRDRSGFWNRKFAKYRREAKTG